MHYCHINSTSLRHIDRVQELVSRAQAAGSRVSTEAYPYGSGMTGIGAAFLAPERLHERGLVPSDLTYAPTGEQVASAGRLRELRATDPGGLAIIRHLDETNSDDRAVLLRALTFPDAVVASDAMPLTWPAGSPAEPGWPLPPGGITHPRTAGTFARSLRVLASEGDGEVGAAGPLGLTETLRRCSLLPAQLLGDQVPAMRRKGRVQPGCDADIVVFDPAAVRDQATYAESTRPSAGIRHVLVNGTLVVRDAAIVPDALPGQADPRDSAVAPHCQRSRLPSCRHDRSTSGDHVPGLSRLRAIPRRASRRVPGLCHPPAQPARARRMPGVLAVDDGARPLPE